MTLSDDPSLSTGSITAWITHLKAGDSDAARLLWERYFDRMVQLARRRLRSRPGAVASEDEEDAALSAFDSFCRGAARGRFAELADRDDLWRMLVVITSRKVYDQMSREGRQKRGGGRVIAESSLGEPGSSGGSSEGGLDNLAGREPAPEFSAMMADQLQRLIAALDDDALRQVALWKLEGYTYDEIARRLGCARRTVWNRLELIRRTWVAEGLLAGGDRGA